MSRYRITRKAEGDIEGIYETSAANFGLNNAEDYLEGLFDVFQILAENPRLARERTEFNPPVRIHPHRSHLIIYMTDSVGVLVIRVAHQRQDWNALLSV